MSELRVLGKDADFQGLDAIEVQGNLTHIIMTSDEVTSTCPITHQPDFYVVTLDFVPNGFTIETKSLKLYFEQFRNEGIFCEDLASRIAQEVQAVIHAKSGTVTVQQKSRGGIVIIATATMVE